MVRHGSTFLKLAQIFAPCPYTPESLFLQGAGLGDMMLSIAPCARASQLHSVCQSCSGLLPCPVTLRSKLKNK